MLLVVHGLGLVFVDSNTKCFTVLFICKLFSICCDFLKTLGLLVRAKGVRSVVLV